MDYCMHEDMTADELLEWAQWSFRRWEYDNEASAPWYRQLSRDYVLMLWAERGEVSGT